MAHTEKNTYRRGPGGVQDAANDIAKMLYKKSPAKKPSKKAK
jgi:hypothetical protein